MKLITALDTAMSGDPRDLPRIMRQDPPAGRGGDTGQRDGKRFPAPVSPPPCRPGRWLRWTGQLPRDQMSRGPRPPNTDEGDLYHGHDPLPQSEMA